MHIAIERLISPLQPIYLPDDSLGFEISILRDLCEGLRHQIAFHVSGFGQASWPVDVTTDLCVFLEQLPEALACLKDRKSFVLDFYEQGLQRRLEGDPDQTAYRLRCLSATDWQPSPSEFTVASHSLENQLQSILSEFSDIAYEVTPVLRANVTFQCWLRTIPVASAAIDKA